MARDAPAVKKIPGRSKAPLVPKAAASVRRAKGRRATGRPASAKDSVGPAALVEITCKLLSKVPPSAITRASVARRAKVDPGLIRYYFDNRESLLRTAAQELTSRLVQSGSAMSEQPALSPGQRICARAKSLLEFKLENRFYHRLMVEDMAESKDADSRASFQTLTQIAVNRYAEYLAAGKADGSLRGVDPVFLYIAVIGMSDFFVTAGHLIAAATGYDGDRQELSKRFEDFLCELLLNGIGARSPETKMGDS